MMNKQNSFSTEYIQRYNIKNQVENNRNEPEHSISYLKNGKVSGLDKALSKILNLAKKKIVTSFERQSHQKPFNNISGLHSLLEKGTLTVKSAKFIFIP